MKHRTSDVVSVIIPRAVAKMSPTTESDGKRNAPLPTNGTAYLGGVMLGSKPNARRLPKMR